MIIRLIYVDLYPPNLSDKNPYPTLAIDANKEKEFLVFI